MTRWATTPKKVLLGYALAIAAWMSIALLSFMQQYLNHIHSKLDVPFVLAVCAMFFSVALVTPPVFYLGRRFPVTEHIARRIGSYLLGFPVFLAAWFCVRWVVAPPWSPAEHSFVPRSWEVLLQGNSGNVVNLWWMYFEVLLTANAFEYYERARTEAVERAHVEQALASSELQALKVQLRPHFLFNTLHGIATLAERDGRRAKAMIVQLSELLRRSLEHGHADLARLTDEMEFISAYLDLEKMRLGPRLVVRWDIAEETRDALVPELVLQPLVENAIIHGIASSREGGWLEIAAERTGARLQLRVRNSLALCPHPGSGLGLKNTRTRLKHLYAEDASLVFSIDQEGGHAEAVVDVPFLASHGEGKMVAGAQQRRSG